MQENVMNSHHVGKSRNCNFINRLVSCCWNWFSFVSHHSVAGVFVPHHTISISIDWIHWSLSSFELIDKSSICEVWIKWWMELSISSPLVFIRLYVDFKFSNSSVVFNGPYNPISSFTASFLVDVCTSSKEKSIATSHSHLKKRENLKPVVHDID